MKNLIGICALLLSTLTATAQCTFSFGGSFAAAGGSGSVSIVTEPGCSWSVTGAPAWISASQTTPTGSGTVNYTVQANTSTTNRSATLTIAGLSFLVAQQAAACTYTLSASSAQFTASGGFVSVTVTTSGNCSWTVSGVPAWVSMSATSGTGTTSLTVTVQANAGTSPRSAVLTIAGNGFTVTQAGSAPSGSGFVKQFGGLGNGVGLCTATDSSGNVVMGGYFLGVCNFGNGSVTSQGSDDAVLAKYSSSGGHLWSLTFGSTLRDRTIGVAVDASGNILVCGYFTGSVNFGGGALSSGGALDMFLAKYSANGVHIWSKRIGGIYDDICYGIAVDTAGNVIITGGFQSTVDFGGTSLTATLGLDFFLAKYSSAGALAWCRRAPATGSEIGYAVAADSNGDLLVTGSFSAVIDFGGGTLSSAGADDIFIVKCSGATGGHIWQKKFGNTSPDSGRGVAVDSNNSVFVTGNFSRTVDFGTGPLTAPIGATDAFVASFNSSGTAVWSKRFGAPVMANGNAITASANGNIFATGFFQGTASVDGQSVVSRGGSDVFVSKYSANGTHILTQGSGGIGSDLGYGISSDPSGNSITTGKFESSATFGSTVLTSPGRYDSDIFLLKIAN